jgi:hypothetical protein
VQLALLAAASNTEDPSYSIVILHMVLAVCHLSDDLIRFIQGMFWHDVYVEYETIITIPFTLF